MTVKQKNRTNRTRKNRRKIMRGGGLLDLFSKPKLIPVSTIIERSQQETTKANQSILGMSTVANTKLASSLANTALVGTVASNIGYGAVAGLAATGVGIPLAGAIAGALLIANKLSNMYLNNLKLFPIMFDTMSILTNCYKLNELIGKAYEIIKKKIPSLNKSNTDLVNKISIDPEIQNHIFIKVNDLTAYLLNIAEDSVLEVLIKDDDIKRSKFLGPVQKEYDLRKNQKIINYFNKVQRGINRFIYVSDTKSDIIDNLSLINSFFIIIKSQYDFALQLYEREFGETWKDILTEIESTQEYAKYLIPVQNLSNETTQIVNSEDQIGIAANNAIKSVVNSDANRDANNVANRD